ncbi:MAG: hypothetical protein LBU14_04240 [Candidatus Peribacteria bacterium]|nr:hypothetical protein [Candidatus Peribacteria bacterium]
MIVFLLTVLVFNLFFSSKNQNTKDTLDIAFQYSKYTIPASVNILVKNYTDSPIGIDTCNDLNILKSGEKMDF